MIRKRRERLRVLIETRAKGGSEEDASKFGHGAAVLAVILSPGLPFRSADLRVHRWGLFMSRGREQAARRSDGALTTRIDAAATCADIATTARMV